MVHYLHPALQKGNEGRISVFELLFPQNKNQFYGITLLLLNLSTIYYGTNNKTYPIQLNTKSLKNAVHKEQGISMFHL